MELRDDLLKELLKLSRLARVGDLDSAATNIFNQVIGRAYNELKLDMRGLLVQPGEHTIPPPSRHTDEGPLKPEELSTCLMNRNDFRAKLEEAIARLDAEH